MTADERFIEIRILMLKASQLAAGSDIDGELPSEVWPGLWFAVRADQSREWAERTLKSLVIVEETK